MRSWKVLLCCLAALLTALWQPVAAQAEPAKGVALSLTADKAEYAAGDVAQITLTLQNDGATTAEDVLWTVELPESMQVAEGSQTTGAVEQLAAGEDFSATIEARVLAPTSASAIGARGDEIPKTGDASIALVAACAGGGLLLCALAILAKRKGGQRGLRVIAAAVLAACALGGAPQVAHAVEGTRATAEASCSVTVNGTPEKLHASVSYTTAGGAASDSDEDGSTITRAEWISELLKGTGAQMLETNARPFGDVDGHTYQQAIETAWVLGILPDDGDSFDPDTVANRDFVYSVAALAAGVDGGSHELTASDAADAEHPELLAAAIDAGLLSADDAGRVNPTAPFDLNEADGLIARVIELGTRHDEEPEDGQEQASYEYRRDVHVFSTYTALGNGGYLIDGASEVAAGDRIALEAPDGSQESMLGTVSSIVPTGSAALITIEPASDPSEIFASITLDAQNLVINASQMELAEGVEFADASMSRSARDRIDIDADTDLTNLTLSYPESGEGDFTVNASLSIQPYVNVDWVWNPLFLGPRRFELGFGAVSKLNGTVDASLDESVSLPLFSADVPVPIPGFSVGTNVDVVFTAEGHIELLATLDSEAGVRYNRVGGLEPYGSFDSDAKLELKAGFRAGVSPWVSLDFLLTPLVDGSFAAGIDGSGSTIVRDTGLICNDTSLYAYARVALGENSPVFQWIDDVFDWSLSYDLWDEDSSPFSEQAHWENGVLVDSCTYREGDTGDGDEDDGTGTGVVDPSFDGIPEQEDEGWGHEPTWTVSDSNHAEIVEPFYIDAGRSITVTAQEGCNYRGMFGASGNTLVRRTVAFEDGEVIIDFMQGVFMFPWDSTDVSTVTLDVLVGRLKVWNLEGWGTDPQSGEVFAARPVYSLDDCAMVSYPVSLSATVVTVGVGESYQLKAQQTVESLYESEGCDYTDGTQWSWESDDSRIAAVDDNGRIVGMAPGTTYVTVTYGNGSMGFDRICKVVVTE